MDTPSRRLLRLVDADDLISTDPLRRLISEVVNVDGLLAAHQQLRVVACNWDTGQPVVFANDHDRPPQPSEDTNGKVERIPLTRTNVELAILASTAIPAIFPRIKIDGDYFVDGGVVMNTPLEPAVTAGATELHVIYLEPKLETLPLGRAPSAFEEIERLLIAAPSRLIEADIRYMKLQNEHSEIREKILIHRHFPSRSIGGAIGLLNFDEQRLLGLIELGFKDAVEHNCDRNGCLTH